MTVIEVDVTKASEGLGEAVKTLEGRGFSDEDIGKVLIDNLFKRFSEKLEKKNYSEDKKRKVYEVAIEAIIKTMKKYEKSKIER